jgi:hypothetical protein
MNVGISGVCVYSLSELPIDVAGIASMKFETSLFC